MSSTSDNLALIPPFVWKILRHARYIEKIYISIEYSPIFIFPFSSIFSIRARESISLFTAKSLLPLMRGMVTRNPHAFILKSRKRTDFRNDRSPIIISIPRALRESSPHYRTYLAQLYRLAGPIRYRFSIYSPPFIQPFFRSSTIRTVACALQRSFSIERFSRDILSTESTINPVSFSTLLVRVCPFDRPSANLETSWFSASSRESSPAIYKRAGARRPRSSPCCIPATVETRTAKCFWRASIIHARPSYFPPPVPRGNKFVRSRKKLTRLTSYRFAPFPFQYS